MRVIASIYLTIILVNFAFWFAGRSGEDIFPTPYFYLVWALYFFSILALLAYVVGSGILPRRVWQGVLLLYVTTRLLELLSADVMPAGEGLMADLNAVAGYLWIVLPPGLAMAYLGFSKHAGRKEPTSKPLEYSRALPR